MLSPLMTVVVLTVLWLIVVVPMVVRRSDERRRERSVDGFGRAMRALGRRATVDESAPEVFVRNQHSQQRAPIAAPDRRPVPAAQEALMYPPDRSEMSAARTQMLARRRRSLRILLGGSMLFGLLAIVMGGKMWLLAAPFVLGSIGYLWFLRNQALRDRARRENRQRRATRRATSYDLTEEAGRFEQPPESVVRIDDDDVELMSMDTIDLTGLYNEDLEPAAVQRRAS
jgi:membrane protein implicated in regulation of membrane protease activity